MKLWKQFHDRLPDGNSNKIPKLLQGLYLQSQLFGRAVDLVKKLTSEKVESEDGALKVATAIHKQDVLSLVTDTFHLFLDLLRTKQTEKESFKNFETRFDAQVCKLNATCPGSEIPSALVSFLLLGNSRVDTAQRVSVLSAVVPSSLPLEVIESSSEVLTSISYSEIATILRACDEPRSIGSSSNRVYQSFSSSSTRNDSNRRRQKQTLTPDQLADLKSKSTCNRCHQLGHWASDRSKCPQSSEYTDKNQRGGSAPTRNDLKKPKVSTGGTIQFHMASVSQDSFHEVPGPLVDDCAPYSAIGIVELRSLKNKLVPNWKGKLEDRPRELKDRCYWQYGSGNHASPKRPVIGSIVLSATTDQGTPIQIRHLVLEGSSPWVIGRNVTRFCDIRHIEGNSLAFSVEGKETQTLSLTDVVDHSYLDASVFMKHSTSSNEIESSAPDQTMVCLTCSLNSAKISWDDTKKVLNKVHRHVCGHASYNDIKLLLDRNRVWSTQCEKYLSDLMERCPSCRIVLSPTGSRKVSLRSMSRSFNDVVCVDHFFIDQLDNIHFMDAQIRYSSGLLVPSTSMRDALFGFELKWLSEFWAPTCVQGNKAFSNDVFKNYVSIYDISFRMVPPRRHYKNVLESKHRVLRDIYLRLKADDENHDPRLTVSKMFRISNDLYGNNYASSHELAKGYTRPVSHEPPQSVPSFIVKAQEILSAKRKLNLILSSKSVQELPVHVGDYVQVYTRLQNQKSGSWSEPKPVLSIDPAARIISVPGAAGRRREVAIEDVRFAIQHNDLAVQVQEANDLLSEDLKELIASSQSATESNDDIDSLEDSYSPHSEGIIPGHADKVKSDDDQSGSFNLQTTQQAFQDINSTDR